MKMCQCEPPARGAYSCARCNRTCCMACDRPVDAAEVKTVVRYCPDWRCRREKSIESGDLSVVPRRVS